MSIQAGVVFGVRLSSGNTLKPARPCAMTSQSGETASGSRYEVVLPVAGAAAPDDHTSDLAAGNSLADSPRDTPKAARLLMPRAGLSLAALRGFAGCCAARMREVLPSPLGSVPFESLTTEQVVRYLLLTELSARHAGTYAELLQVRHSEAGC